MGPRWSVPIHRVGMATRQIGSALPGGLRCDQIRSGDDLGSAGCAARSRWCRFFTRVSSLLRGNEPVVGTQRQPSCRLRVAVAASRLIYGDESDSRCDRVRKATPLDAHKERNRQIQRRAGGVKVVHADTGREVVACFSRPHPRFLARDDVVVIESSDLAVEDPWTLFVRPDLTLSQGDFNPQHPTADCQASPSKSAGAGSRAPGRLLRRS